MSKKHFEALAAALATMKPDDPQSASYAQWTWDVDRVAGVCASFNTRFDSARFLKACGVEG
jgi:hypothetical protein